MSDKPDEIKVNAICKALGIHRSTTHRFKQLGILVPSEGKTGYYTRDSFEKIKSIIDEYRATYGINPSTSICESAYLKNTLGAEK